MRFYSKHFKRDFNQWSLYTVAISLFIAIPVFTIIFHLFNGKGEMWDHIVTYFLLDYVLNSIILLFGTGIICFSFGTASAWIVTKYDFPYRKLIEWLLFMPLAIPSYIVAYSYVGLLGNGGTFIRFLNMIGIPIKKIEMMNIYGLIAVLSFSLFPYVYAGTRAMFKSYPNSIRESAYLLGASEIRYFFSVALPLASPAIIGGLFLVFMEVLNDYGAAKYYGINTFTTGIFRTWTALEDIQSSIYLSALLVVLVLFLLAMVKWFRGKKSYALKFNNEDKTKRFNLVGYKKTYLIVVFIPILAGFVFPVIQLLIWAVQTFEVIFNYALFSLVIQSVFVALFTALIIVLTALLLIYFSRWSILKTPRFFPKIATLGYVIPGAIIGIGIIRSSNSIIVFFDTYLNLKVGYLFYGSSVVLIYAYIFRFLAVGYNSIEANTLKLGKHLEQTSYLLGIDKFVTFIKIDLPLLRNSIISAFVLVFIDTLKELPLTLILKPYDLNTLAVKAYEYAEDERVAEASIPALLLILIIAILITLINYKKSKPN